jgi:hypothetical protein
MVKLPIDVNERTSKNHVRFTNLVRTDGFAIDFIFAESIGEAEEDENDVYISDYHDFDPSLFRLWGLDPGLNSTFIASDGSNRHDNINADIPHEILQMITAEFYCRAGYKKTNRRISLYKDEHTDDQPDIVQPRRPPKEGETTLPACNEEKDKYMCSPFKNDSCVLLIASM